jgi:hypothetical protein
MTGNRGVFVVSRLIRSALRSVILILLSGPGLAAVQVVTGPTPIVDGDAKAAGDITILNEKAAFALAVESPVPYGVPRGALIDAAAVKEGKVGRDHVVFADFIPNDWSGWPNTYQHVDILERGPERAVIRIVRDWGKVTITSLYTLETNSDQIEIKTTMSNGGEAALSGLLSGMTLWPKGGFFFGIPGMTGVAAGKTDSALADRVVAYDEDWTVTLHAPYLDHVDHSSLDLYRLHTLAAGESRDFTAWLQVGPRGDLRPVILAEIERKRLASGLVRGTVTAGNGSRVKEPVVVIEKQGKSYAWILGHDGAYELTLPIGDYDLYATAKNYSQSGKTRVRVKSGAVATRDFRKLESPGKVHFAVTDADSGKPLDARIVIKEGQKPLVEFLGRKTFFTELDRKGQLDVSIAPGRYVFDVSSGGGFLSRNQQVVTRVATAASTAANIVITPLFDPPARKWYSADLHHHADQAEAVTPPEDLARSQLAAGLDLLFVSDHDSTVNHRTLQRIADQREVPFIAGMELSPSWGHFNAYPLNLGQQLAIDTGTASVDAILGEARRQGAIVVQSNHPFIPYGYFASLAAGIVPGGFNPKFDLVEINASAPADDDKVLQKMWEFWNSGHHYYLTAGTDTHDVWNEVSGRVRAFVHIDGKVTPAVFAQALKAGRGYVTHGPLIYPTIMFGEQLRVKPDEAFVLGFDLESVVGLKKASLIAAGNLAESKEFAATAFRVHVEFALKTDHANWYEIIVEDRLGQKAYADPIWVDPVVFGGSKLPSSAVSQ